MRRRQFWHPLLLLAPPCCFRRPQLCLCYSPRSRSRVPLGSQNTCCCGGCEFALLGRPQPVALRLLQNFLSFETGQCASGVPCEPAHTTSTPHIPAQGRINQESTRDVSKKETKKTARGATKHADRALTATWTPTLTYLLRTVWAVPRVISPEIVFITNVC